MTNHGLAFALSLFLAALAPALAADPPRVDAVSKGYKLTFSDEFNGPDLDHSKWIDSYPGGKRTHANNEQEYYAPDGWQVRDGQLVFKADKRSMNGKPYTSGMVSSFGKFSQQYGWFEARMKVPGSQGMWPAFWLLPSSEKWPPEIDIMELIGREKNKVYLTLHERQPGTWKPKSFGHDYEIDDFTKDYHTYAVDWMPGEIVWYVDGVERHRVKDEGVPKEPMYILLNLAVGGDWPRMPDATTVFPSSMQIDYVRVYQSPANAAQ
jgi:beta-glucanase (GH16 family)